MAPVRLVAARGHHLRDPRGPAGRLERRPCPGDVRLERRDRVLVGDDDLSLRGEVEDGADLVLTEEPFEQSLVRDVAFDNRDLLAPMRHDRQIRHPVALQHDDVRAE